MLPLFQFQIAISRFVSGKTSKNGTDREGSYIHWYYLHHCRTDNLFCRWQIKLVRSFTRRYNDCEGECEDIYSNHHYDNNKCISYTNYLAVQKAILISLNCFSGYVPGSEARTSKAHDGASRRCRDMWCRCSQVQWAVETATSLILYLFFSGGFIDSRLFSLISYTGWMAYFNTCLTEVFTT